MTIPIIDVETLYRYGQEFSEVAEEVGRGFSQFGLVYVRVNEGFGGDAYSFFTQFHKFIANKAARAQCTPSEGSQRGWSGDATEVSVTSGGVQDYKSWYFAQVADGDYEENRKHLERLWPYLHQPNIWPTAMPEFKRTYERFSRGLCAIGGKVMEACAHELGLDRNTFWDLMHNGPHVARALAYHPMTQEMLTSGKFDWGGMHTDFNLATVLGGGVFVAPDGNLVPDSPDDRAGLFIRTRGGEKIKGTPPPGCVVVQVGQALEILTAGRFLATGHQICAPRTPNWGRLAGVIFMHGDSNQMLAPMNRYNTRVAMKLYGPPRLFGTFAHATLKKIGLYDGPASAELAFPDELLVERLK